MRCIHSILPILAASGLLVLVLYSTQFSTVDTPENFRRAVEQYVLDGRKQVRSYAARVEANLNESLVKLFDDLDKNHDGCVDQTEFHGRTLNVLATVHSIELPKMGLPNELPSVEYSVSIARRVVGLQFLFLVVLFIVENVRVVVFPKSLSLKCGPVDWNAQPSHCTLDKAMRYDTPSTPYEKLKFLFFVISGVLFLRIALTIVFFIAGILLVNLSVIGGRSRATHPRWFWCCTIGVKLFGYLALASMGFYHIRVVGKRAPQSETKLLIGNHICMIEVIALYLLADMPSFVSRVENLTLPLFRGLAAASDAVIVDRDAAASRSKTLDAIRKRANDSNATQLLIFPEGTCANQLALFQFKKGAFEPGVPVQMVCFRFPYKHFNAAWTGRASGGNDAWDLLLRLWSQFVNRLEVRFLPVYIPSDAERADPVRYAKHCQQVMADIVGCDTSDAQFANYVDAAKEFNRRNIVNGDSNATTPRSVGHADESRKSQ